MKILPVMLLLLIALRVEALSLLLPDDPRSASIVKQTSQEWLKALGAPLASEPLPPGSADYLLAGSPDTNPTLKRLVGEGLSLTKEDLGDEGFQLLTYQKQHPRYTIVYANTPRGLKHGLQELLFYHFDTQKRTTEWPLNIVRKPAWPYRGIYILPCWSALDSYKTWESVIRFCSELTLNRVWFWLDGFPVAGHTGEYAGTALADANNVQKLLDLSAGEDMKLLIGGGWFNWHHEKAVGHDLKKGVDYYLQYIDAFRNFDGFYIEPTGEGSENKNWDDESKALRSLIDQTLRRKPEFEFALAIGKFNNEKYLKRMAEVDPKRVFWWWCWGDPVMQQAQNLHPSVLRWHTVIKMSDYHGSIDPPKPSEEKLTGFATSYDPGQGYGNPWNGWGKMGFDKPRDVHPYTVPFFAHEYFFRERCWNPNLTQEQFIARLHRRLFDSDAPSDAGQVYWKLSQLAFDMNAKRPVKAQDVDPIRRLVLDLAGRSGTPRQQDTLGRMKEALDHLPAK